MRKTLKTLLAICLVLLMAELGFLGFMWFRDNHIIIEDFPPRTTASPEATAAPETTKAAASTSSVSSPLLTLVMRYAQKFPIQLYGEHYTLKGDTAIKYRRGGTVEIVVEEGYEIVDVVANGQSLGAVNEVTFKKVTKAPELLVITRAVGTGN